MPPRFEPVFERVIHPRLPAWTLGAESSQYLSVKTNSDLLLGAAVCRTTALFGCGDTGIHFIAGQRALFLIHTVPDKMLVFGDGARGGYHLSLAHFIHFQAYGFTF